MTEKWQAGSLKLDKKSWTEVANMQTLFVRDLGMKFQSHKDKVTQVNQ